MHILYFCKQIYYIFLFFRLIHTAIMILPYMSIYKIFYFENFRNIKKNIKTCVIVCLVIK